MGFFKSITEGFISSYKDGTEDIDYEIRYNNDSKQWVVEAYQTGLKRFNNSTTLSGLAPVGLLIPADEIVLLDEYVLPGNLGQISSSIDAQYTIDLNTSIRVGNKRWEDPVYSRPLRQDEIARLVQNNDGKWVIDGVFSSIPDARLSNGRLDPFRSFANKDGVPTTQAKIEKVSLAILDVGMSGKNRYKSLASLTALWRVPMYSMYGSATRDAMVALGILTPTPTAQEQRHPAVVGGKIAHDREAKGKFWANVYKWGGRLVGIASTVAVGLAFVTGGTALVVAIVLATVAVVVEASGAFVESVVDQTAFKTGEILAEEKHPNVFLNGNRVARLGTPVKCKEEHPDLAYNAFIEGSKTVFINGRPMVRVGHKTSCGAFAFKGETYVQTGLWTTVHDVPVEGFYEIWNAISKDVDNGYNMNSWFIGLLVSSAPKRTRKYSPLYGHGRNTDPIGNPRRIHKNLPRTPLEKALQDPVKRLRILLRAARMRSQNANRVGGGRQQPNSTTPPPLPPAGNPSRPAPIGAPIGNHYGLPPTSISSMGRSNRPTPIGVPPDGYWGEFKTQR